MDMQEILKQFRTLSESDDECNMSEAGKYCPVHGMEECSMMQEDDAVGGDDRGVEDDLSDTDDEEAIKRQDDEYYQAVKRGDIPEEVVEPDRFLRYYEQKYGSNTPIKSDMPNNTDIGNEGADDTDSEDLKEGVNISLDGQDAEAFISRLTQLAGNSVPSPILGPGPVTGVVPGQSSLPPQSVENNVTCRTCGQSMAQCQCGNNENDCCPQCGAHMGECKCDNTVNFGPDGIMDENIDNDFGHTDHPDVGEPVDPNTYMYKAPNGPQRIVKGMLGDNSLIKENASKLFVKLKNDYRAYIAEADLAASNVPGAQSPLTATKRDAFEKDPFAGSNAVVDGSHSPLSTIKRQDVLK